MDENILAPGVTVLSEKKVREVSAKEMALLVLGVVIVAVSLPLVCDISALADFGSVDASGILLCLLGILVFAVMLGALAYGIRLYRKTHLEYRVTLDRTADFLDFYYKFEILARDGNIFTVRLRDV